MPKASPLQDSFNSGEFSPLVQGKITADRYKTGLDTCVRWFPLSQGPVTRCPGTHYVASFGNVKGRLQSFIFSETQAYIISFNGNVGVTGYVFRNGAQLFNGFSPVTIGGMPYTDSEIFQLKFAQSADTLYVSHPKYPPAKIQRVSDISWTYTVIDFQDGPYLDPFLRAANNLGPPQLSVAAGPTLTPTVNISNFNGVNGGQGFLVTDVGRLIRLFVSGVVNWGFIFQFNNASQVVVHLRFGISGGVPAGFVDSWALGVWSVTTGYPAAVVFHEDRLTFGGGVQFPDRIDMSAASNYEVFAPTQVDNTVIGSDAVSFTLNSAQLNQLKWLTSDEKGLNAGSIGAEWNIRPSSLGEAITPTNVCAKKATSYGSADVQPVQIGKATMFVQRGAKKIREMVFFYDVEGFRANDLTLLSEHITSPGIVQLALSVVPQQIVWAVRSDGVLLAMNYEREVDVLKTGWSRHPLGSAQSPEPAKVESVAVIPDPTGTYDQVWLYVSRYVNGTAFKTVEYIGKIFETSDLQRDAFFVDAGITHDIPKTITGITSANPPVVTSTAHGFSNGDVVRIEDVNSLASPPAINIAATVNDRDFTVAGVTANTFQLQGKNFTGFPAYFSGGEARKLVSQISGLDHLEGLSVAILADGASVQAAGATTVVLAGVINLPVPAAVVHVGLAYNSDLKFLRPDVGAADGTAHGKIRRVHRFGVDYYRTLGLMVGSDFDSLDRIEMRERSDIPGRAPSLKSKIDVYTIDMNYDFDNKVCIRVSDPLPATILAVMPRLNEEDA